jgi:hypothetical protein
MTHVEQEEALGLDMRMHIPQTRNQIFAPSVDHPRPWRDLCLGSGLDGHNPIPANQHGVIRAGKGCHRIQHRHADYGHILSLL